MSAAFLSMTIASSEWHSCAFGYYRDERSQLGRSILVGIIANSRAHFSKLMPLEAGFTISFVAFRLSPEFHRHAVFCLHYWLQQGGCHGREASFTYRDGSTGFDILIYVSNFTSEYRS